MKWRTQRIVFDSLIERVVKTVWIGLGFSEMVSEEDWNRCGSGGQYSHVQACFDVHGTRMSGVWRPRTLIAAREDAARGTTTVSPAKNTRAAPRSELTPLRRVQASRSRSTVNSARRRETPCSTSHGRRRISLHRYREANPESQEDHEEARIRRPVHRNHRGSAHQWRGVRSRSSRTYPSLTNRYTI